MHSLRFLARRKIPAAIAILIMGLALGANTAALSVLRAFLLSSLGVPEPERVVLVAPVREMPGRGKVTFSDAFPNYQLLRQTQRAFAEVATFVQLQSSWADHGEARSLSAARATASFFATMGVRPRLGRSFTAEEEGPSPAPVVVISHGLWTSSFGADPGIVGRAIVIDGAPHTVIGVMPPAFAHPLPTDIWLPFDIPATQRTAVNGARQLTVYARLADGVSLAAARRDIARFTARSIEATLDNKDYRYDVTPLREVLLDGAGRSALFVEIGAVILLALAILNLASLLVAWGFERRTEMAVRLALGAGGGRIVGLLVRPSLVIAGAGAALGVALAFVGLRVLQRFDLGPTLTALAADARLDASVLAATTTIAILCGLVAGVLPALFGRDATPGAALRASSRSATLSRAALRWQQAMVVGQAALSAAILAASALMLVSFSRLAAVPAGFVTDGRVVARVVLPDARYGDHARRALFGRALAENLASEPGLESSGFTTTLPVSDIVWGGRFFIELPDGSRSPEPALFHLRRVSPGYRRAMGIPLLRGRDLTAQDDSGSVAVAIVSTALASRLWPGEDPLGRRLLRVVNGKPEPAPVTVVGVVGNTMDAGAGAPPGEAVYVPYAQVSSARLAIVATGRGDMRATVAAVRRALRKTDPVLAAGTTTTLESLALAANALPRLRSLVLTVFALVALGIVSLGSYSVMSQLVSSREREIAVRLVFGAEPRRIGASVLGQVARLTLPGVALGLAVVVLGGTALETFVFGVEARSPSVLAAAGGVLLLLSLLATLPPARRAMRVDISRSVAS